MPSTGTFFLGVLPSPKWDLANTNATLCMSDNSFLKTITNYHITKLVTTEHISSL